MQEKIELLQTYIEEAQNIVFLGGAGVSTECGIPDFRSQNGLYRQPYDVAPETILSISYFHKNPQKFFAFYKDKMNSLTIKPGFTHSFLKQLETCGKLKAIITQNIDGLHEKAGSTNVLELHGSIYRNYCTHCGKFFSAEEVFHSKNIPMCSCHHIIKPDVVLYGELLDNSVWEQAEKMVKQADLLIVGGTSLMVYPANSLLHYFKGQHLVIINQDKTPLDNKANLVIHDKLETVFKQLTI